MNYTVFLAGIAMASFGASGLFFLKLWRASQDRFFLYFAIACWFLCVERVAALFAQGIFSPRPNEFTESSSWIYLMRLFAFIMILIAIIVKNRHKKL